MHMFYCCYVIDWQKTKFLEKLTISEKHLCFSMMLNDNVLHVYCNVCLKICLPSEFRYVTGELYFGKKYFFQILWKSRCNILVSFPSHLKKLCSILRFWLEKLKVEKTSQNNFSSQNFSVENNYYYDIIFFQHSNCCS